MSPKSTLKDYFEESIALYPSWRAFLGDRSGDGDLENVLSRTHEIKRKRLVMKYRSLNTLQGSAIDKNMLKWVLQDAVEGMRFSFELLPIDSHENSIVDFTFLNTQMYPLKTDDDLQNMWKRHVKYQSVMVSMVHKLNVGIRKRVVLPKLICKRLIKSLRSFLKNRMYVPTIPNALAQTKTCTDFVKYLHSEYRRSIIDVVTFLQSKYLPHCRDTVGFCHLPKGKAMYRYLVRSMTTLDEMTPEKAQTLGFEEVKRISGEIHALKVKLGYPKDLSLAEFCKQMLADRRNYYGSLKQVYADFVNTRDRINKTVIPKNFHVNVQDHEIQRVPKSMEATSPGAFYYPPSALHATRPGIFYLNMRDLHENPRYATMALSLHEGKPGHHYQFQYMVERGVPVYRMYSVSGTSFVEGWGLYAESLGEYNDKPYDLFGRLTYEMFRAVRLVVDTGIHYYGWTFEQAVSYMMDHLAMSRTEIETEVERYICMPAQALCYKIGELKLQALRKEWMQTFGSSSKSIKDFHEMVLEDGVLPLDVLETKIHHLCQQKQRN